MWNNDSFHSVLIAYQWAKLNNHRLLKLNWSQTGRIAESLRKETRKLNPTRRRDYHHASQAAAVQQNRTTLQVAAVEATAPTGSQQYHPGQQRRPFSTRNGSADSRHFHPNGESDGRKAGKNQPWSQ